MRIDKNIVGKKVGGLFARWRDSLARLLIKAGFTPNTLTLIGLGINVIATIAFGYRRPILAGVILIIAGAFDVLDGAVARMSGRVTSFGAFFDSVIDRYSDIAIFIGIIIYYALEKSKFYITLSVIALIGTIMTSYVRARAECIIPSCKVGFMERPERTVTIIIGSLTNHLYMVVWILAFFTNLTVIHRIFETRRQLAKVPAGVSPEPILSLDETYTPSTPLERVFQGIKRVLFWDYPRLTWQHDLLCGMLIVLLVFAPYALFLFFLYALIGIILVVRLISASSS
ncbi:MAG TPA: CDP-alcohol phosphatidyltransferase family protein [Candidatus Limnocylindrales bacterium]|nr:CDP-alcohol phosphatidyltransferase family protein [Candidatus Limnocylindrales bacterium]